MCIYRRPAYSSKMHSFGIFSPFFRWIILKDTLQSGKTGKIFRDTHLQRKQHFGLPFSNSFYLWGHLLESPHCLLALLAIYTGHGQLGCILQCYSHRVRILPVLLVEPTLWVDHLWCKPSHHTWISLKVMTIISQTAQDIVLNNMKSIK